MITRVDSRASRVLSRKSSIAVDDRLGSEAAAAGSSWACPLMLIRHERSCRTTRQNVCLVPIADGTMRMVA